MTAGAAALHFGVVRTAGQDIAIPSAHLVEAVDLPDRLLPMPQASALMTGMFMLRGQLIPVLDLHRLMAPAAPQDPSPADAPPPARRQVAVVAQGGRCLGIGVDAIAGVLRVAASDVTLLDGASDGLFDRWVTQDGGQALPVLQVAALLTGTPGVLTAARRAAPDDAAAAAPPRDAAAAALPRRHTLVRLRSRVLAFDFAAVPDVMPMPAVRPFFAGSGALRGMVPWRGGEVLLVDLAALLDLDGGEAADAPVARPGSAPPLLMLLQHGGRRIGVQVDALLGMEPVSADAVVPLGAGTVLHPGCYAGALRTAARGIALVLRPEALLAHPLVASFLDTSPATSVAAGGRAHAQDAGAGVRATYLVYQAGGACATLLSEVEEILAYDGPAVRPDGAGDGMRGLMERRGRPLEVFDLRTLMGRPAAVPTTQARVLVVRHGARTRGFVVDSLVSLVAADAGARIGRAGAAAADAAGAGQRSGGRLGPLLALGQGEDALTCRQVDLRALMDPQAEAAPPPSPSRVASTV
jgi:purine-binding chemotaxis protein CheW